MSARLGLLVAGAVLVVGCASSVRPQLVAPPDPTPTPVPEGSVVADGTGYIEVAGVRYELAFSCFDVDDGSTVVVGEGADPQGGGPVTGIVRAGGAPGDGYVAVVFGDVATGAAVESELDSEILLDVDGDRVTGSAIPFVDYGEGRGTDVGLGSLAITCARYEDAVAGDFDF